MLNSSYTARSLLNTLIIILSYSSSRNLITKYCSVQSLLYRLHLKSSTMSDAKKYTAKLSGARILVIGGSSGIGYAVAEASVELGAIVIISSSQDSRVKSSIEKLIETYPSAKDRVSGHACDLSVPTMEENIKKLFEQTGKLDHIVFTAGNTLTTTALQEITLEVAQKAGMVRFFAPLLVAKYAPQYLSPGPASSLTLTTGSASQKPVPGWSVSASYAGGLHSMMRNLALDLKPIRVNLVSPGAVITPMWNSMDKPQLDVFMEVIKGRSTTGEIGQPEDVAEAYLFAMKDKNCTGSVIDSNSGFLLV